MSQVNHPGYPNGEEEVEGVLSALEAEHTRLAAHVADHSDDERAVRRVKEVAAQIKFHEELLDAPVKKPRGRKPVETAETR